MDFLKRFAVDRERAEDGVWVDLGDGLEVCIARFGSARYKSAMARAFTPHVGHEDLSDEDANKITAEAMADGMLLDWRGLSIGGQEIPYSRDAAFLLLSEYDEFRERVHRESRNRDRYAPEDLDAIAQRLGNTLSGSSSTETE